LIDSLLVSFLLVPNYTEGYAVGLNHWQNL